MIFPPELSRKAAEKLKAQGNHVELYEIEGTSGHLDGLVLDRQGRGPHQGVSWTSRNSGQGRNSVRALARRIATLTPNYSPLRGCGLGRRPTLMVASTSWPWRLSFIFAGAPGASAAIRFSIAVGSATGLP